MTTKFSEGAFKVKVADIVFTYDNAEMIKLLSKRGTAIEGLHWKKLHEANEEINKLIKGETGKRHEVDEEGADEALRKLIVPTYCFVTFSNEDHTNMALETRLNVDQRASLFMKSSGFKEAPEPTDIAWENRHFSSDQVRIREVFAYIGVTILLAISFYFVYYLVKE